MLSVQEGSAFDGNGRKDFCFFFFFFVALFGLKLICVCKIEDKADPTTGKRNKTKTVHDEEVLCALCPKAFHLACVDLKEKPSAFPPWKCPWHSCSECRNTSTQGGEEGNVLFRFVFF